MKKLLVAFNATNYSTSLATFAIKIARQSNSILHAVFLNAQPAPVAQYGFPNDMPFASTPLVTTEEMMKENERLLQVNQQLLTDDCTSNGVSCKIEYIDISLTNLIDQTAFADLVLCDAKKENAGILLPELLVNTRCPVLLVPLYADIPAKAVVCYDEGLSSVLAMKMYSYIFPEWKALPTTVLSINPKGDNGLEYDEYLQDWLPQHFSNFKQEIYEGNLQRELVSFIRKNDEPTVVIMGAYGRNAVSRLFHQSLANIVIEETQAMVFIMHE